MAPVCAGQGTREAGARGGFWAPEGTSAHGVGKGRALVWVEKRRRQTMGPAYVTLPVCPCPLALHPGVLRLPGSAGRSRQGVRVLSPFLPTRPCGVPCDPSLEVLHAAGLVCNMKVTLLSAGPLRTISHSPARN